MYELHIKNFLEFNVNKKFRTIYFDPPFNSDRIYAMSESDSVGFSDKWTDQGYEEFITKCIDKLYDLLEKDGTMLRTSSELL